MAFAIGPGFDAAAAPGYGEPLNLTTGVIYNVADATELQNAVSSINDAGVPATVLLADGVYTVNDTLQILCDRVVLRSAGGDRDAVTIRGPNEGIGATVFNLFYVPADNFTIADVTFGYCRWHGIQVVGESDGSAGLWVHNCRIVNCCEQFIKGSSDSDPIGATDGIIENSLFEFTSRWAYQAYTGGIDIHKGVNWIVRDNLFRHIRAATNMCEHAVHFWKRCTTQPQNVLVERNIVIDCDRGIGFGLSNYDGGFNGGSSAIRNNFVYSGGAGAYTDVSIGLEYASGVWVDNNSVYNATYWAPIEYRFTGGPTMIYRNNLVNHAIAQRDSAPAAILSNNVENAQFSWFKDPANGDLHLLPGVSQVLDQGCAIAQFSTDIDNATRPQQGAWDIGADEYDADTADSDNDMMTDAWEQTYGLNPTNAADALLDFDGDGFVNRDEWICQTHPGNSNALWRVTQIATNGVSFNSALNRFYSLESCTNLGAGTWRGVTGQTNVAGSGVTQMLNSAAAEEFRAYRVKIRVSKK